MENLPLIVLGILLVTNLYAFLLMRHDKQCAIKNQWRVPEKKLFIAAGCFGALGGVLGMKVFRHKTKHWYFQVFFPAMLVAQAALLALGAYYLYFAK